MLMPLIPELPENFDATTLGSDTDSTISSDEVDACGESSGETLLLESQAKIAGS